MKIVSFNITSMGLKKPASFHILSHYNHTECHKNLPSRSQVEVCRCPDTQIWPASYVHKFCTLYKKCIINDGNVCAVNFDNKNGHTLHFSSCLYNHAGSIPPLFITISLILPFTNHNKCIISCALWLPNFAWSWFVPIRVK